MTNRWEYIDFELEISEGGPRNYPVTVRSPAGVAREEMHFPFDRWELKDKLQALEIDLLRSGGTRRRMPSPEEKTVQEFGQRLLQALLVGEVRTRYVMSVREARQQNKGLRLKLRIRPPELAALPWEFLYDPDHDEYLCLSSTTPLVRYLDLPEPVERLRVSPPLRILGMIASPLGLDELDVGHEKRLVEEAIKDLAAGELVEMTWLEGQTWSDLARAMRRGSWHIFHFIGHGGFDPVSDEGAIALADEAGRKSLLRARELARLLDGHYPLKLVLLNSCEGARGSERDAFSSTAATLVRRGVPAVLAMQYEITDEAAITFARDFYQAVADGLPVDAAVTEARKAVSYSLHNSLEWGTPVLYMRSEDGRIFDVSDKAEPPKRGQEAKDREDLLSRYRDCVESALADGELHGSEVEWLRDIAANKLGLSLSTAADIEREILGDTKDAVLERRSRQRGEEERRKRLEEFYAQARWRRQNQEWQAVIDVFDQIRALDPQYPDPEGLLSSAHEALVAQKQKRRAAAKYEQAKRHMEAEEWQQALRCLEELQRLEPGYQDTESLLLRVRQELAKSEPVEVPDLAGLSRSEASSALAAAGLKLGDQNEAPSDTASEGETFEQSPKAGTKVKQGGLVSVTVSLGSQRGTVTGFSGGNTEEAGRTLSSVTGNRGIVGRVTGNSMMVASFVLSTLTSIVFVLVLIGAMAEGSETGPFTILLGFTLFLSPLVYILTSAIGVAGIIQRRRKKLFAVLGTLVSGLGLVGIFLLLLLGLFAS